MLDSALGMDSTLVNAGHKYKLVEEWLERSSAVRDLWLLVSSRLSISQQRESGQAGGQTHPGVHQTQHHQPVRRGDHPAVLSSGAVSPGELWAVLGRTI